MGTITMSTRGGSSRRAELAEQLSRRRRGLAREFVLAPTPGFFVLILTLDAGRFGVGSHAGILCAAFLALIHLLCQFVPDGAAPN